MQNLKYAEGVIAGLESLEKNLTLILELISRATGKHFIHQSFLLKLPPPPPQSNLAIITSLVNGLKSGLSISSLPSLATKPGRMYCGTNL